MSYTSRAALFSDPAFRSRVVTCCKEQALIFQGDPDPSVAAFADAVVMSSTAAVPLVELVAIAPDFTEVSDQLTITDLQVLSVVQAQWPIYAALAYPPPA